MTKLQCCIKSLEMWQNPILWKWFCQSFLWFIHCVYMHAAICLFEPYCICVCDRTSVHTLWAQTNIFVISCQFGYCCLTCACLSEAKPTGRSWFWKITNQVEGFRNAQGASLCSITMIHLHKTAKLVIIALANPCTLWANKHEEWRGGSLTLGGGLNWVMVWVKHGQG